jgi:hypothetical protein
MWVAALRFWKACTLRSTIRVPQNLGYRQRHPQAIQAIDDGRCDGPVGSQRSPSSVTLIETGGKGQPAKDAVVRWESCGHYRGE